MSKEDREQEVDDINYHMFKTDEVSFKVKQDCTQCGTELHATIRDPDDIDNDIWDVECNHFDCDWKPEKNVYLSLTELVEDYNVILK